MASIFLCYGSSPLLAELSKLPRPYLPANGNSTMWMTETSKTPSTALNPNAMMFLEGMCINFNKKTKEWADIHKLKETAHRKPLHDKLILSEGWPSRISALSGPANR